MFLKANPKSIKNNLNWINPWDIKINVPETFSPSAVTAVVLKLPSPQCIASLNNLYIYQIRQNAFIGGKFRKNFTVGFQAKWDFDWLISRIVDLEDIRATLVFLQALGCTFINKIILKGDWVGDIA